MERSRTGTIALSVLSAAAMAAFFAPTGVPAEPVPTTVARMECADTRILCADLTHRTLDRASRSAVLTMTQIPTTAPRVSEVQKPVAVSTSLPRQTVAPARQPVAPTTTTSGFPTIIDGGETGTPSLMVDGFVTDGGPQLDDDHCVGTTAERVRCLVARRPECRHWVRAMDRATAQRCWAPELAVYPWPAAKMLNALICESRGREGAVNGRYRGLLQDDGGVGDAAVDLEHAYRVKWLGQGASAWRSTYGRVC